MLAVWAPASPGTVTTQTSTEGGNSSPHGYPHPTREMLTASLGSDEVGRDVPESGLAGWRAGHTEDLGEADGSRSVSETEGLAT